jgi:magnesium transporter
VTASGVVASVLYRGGRRVRDVAIPEIAALLGDPEGFVWIGLHEPPSAVLAELQRAFGLHELAIEDATRAHQRSKLERYGDSLFVVLRTAQRDAGGAVEFGETHLFVGPRYVVTVRHGSSLGCVDVRARVATSSASSKRAHRWSTCATGSCAWTST